MGLRIAIGRCNCRGAQYRSPIRQAAAKEVLERIDQLSKTAPESLRSLPEQREERLNILDFDVYITTYRVKEKNGDHVIVVQAFVPTLWLPTIISFDGTGHILAEGITLKTDGSILETPEDEMWGFR